MPKEKEYKHLDKYLKNKGLQTKVKTKKKEVSLTPDDIQKLTIQMLKDFGYVE